MKIIFIGNVDFSKDCLQRIIDLRGEIVGVLTKSQNSYNSDFCNLSTLACNNNIPYKYFNDINDKENIEWIKEKKPDIIFCFGISQLIKEELLELAPMGILGFHPALLPQNRGRHPIIWALALGLNETGSTFFFMEEGADSGSILSQEKVSIFDDDDAKSLYMRIRDTAIKQIEIFLPQLQKGCYKVVKQDNEKANSWRKRGIRDGEIDWRMSTQAIINLVRALTKPYPGAHFNYNGNFIKVWTVEQVKLDESYNNMEPGKIIKYLNNYPVVKCYDGYIQLIEYEENIKFEVGEYI